MSAAAPDDATAEPPLPPLVRRLGWVSFFADAASEMLYPLVPLFLTVTLGAPAAVVGLVEGLADGVATGLRAFAGWVTDRFRDNRVLVVGGYTVSSLAKPLLALAPGWVVVALLRVTDRFGKAFRGIPRDVMLTEAVPAEQRGHAFGFHRAMDTAGAVVGPLVAAAALLAVGERNLRPVFLLALVPGLATIALVFGLPRSTTRSQGGQWEDATLPWRGSYGTLVVALVVFGLGNSSDAFLLLRAHDLGLTEVQVILAYASYNVVYAALSTPVGRRSDRVGRLPLFRGGLLVFAAVYLGFGLAPGAWAVWPLLAVYGVYMALTDGIGKALVVDLVPPSVRGKALGYSQALNGAAVLIAGITAGELWDHVSPAAPFIVGSITAVVSIGVVSAVRPRAAA